ncbi:sulfite exporter TauE/SafE family protein [Actinoplanes sp. NBRC 101535]|uniref:HoxN/HupN/NixA family nickel/cobalt transporter n=1 Tax=Actinoplanes sp. NBRC 101535 TaxID=3032196 RepID=UPI002557A245|nr:sulfite exporter TauE/SafE family protein [Actinoplanes sp. NBRC 101535]
MPGRGTLRRGLLVAVAALAGGMLLPAAPAVAHPLDQVVHEVTLYPDGGVLGIEVDLLPGALIAGAFARTVDTDGDGALSAAEISAHAATVVSALSVTADGVPVVVEVGRTSYPDYPVMAAGGGVTAILASITLPAGTGTITFTDGYRSGLSETAQIGVEVAADATVAAEEIVTSDDARTVSFRTAARQAVAAGDQKESGGFTERALTALREPLASPWTLVLLIGVCALLGGFHALTPGHGKTLMAAYLVGTRGTPRQAITLGGIITVTHTASVILLGTAVVLLGDRVMPGVLVPALELTAGAVVLVLGVRLAVGRWRGLRSGGHTHDHSHEHTHDHDHAHGHSHSHSHHVPRSRREMLAMGLTGGMIPCPEALSILILAVGLHRTGLGLAMIVAFSVGLAAVLVGLGLFLVTVRGALQRVRPAGDGVLITRLPLASAAVVVVLGAVMVSTGLVHVADATAL